MVVSLGKKIDLDIFNNYLIYDPKNFSFQLTNYTDNEIVYSYNSNKIYNAASINKLLIAIIFCLKYKKINSDERNCIYNMIANSNNKDTILIDSKITFKDEQKFFENYYPEFKNKLQRIKMTDFEHPIDIEYLSDQFIKYNKYSDKNYQNEYFGINSKRIFRNKKEIINKIVNKNFDFLKKNKFNIEILIEEYKKQSIEKYILNNLGNNIKIYKNNNLITNEYNRIKKNDLINIDNIYQFKNELYKDINFNDFLLSLYKNYDCVRYYNGNKKCFSGSEKKNYSQINCNILNKILGDLFTNKLNINRNKDIILNAMKNCKTGHSHKYLPENKFDIYTKSGTFKNFRHEHNVFYYKSKLYGLTFLSKSSKNYPYGIHKNQRGHVSAGLIYLLLELESIKFNFFEIKHYLNKRRRISLYNRDYQEVGHIRKYNIKKQYIYGFFNIYLDKRKIHSVRDPIIEVIFIKNSNKLIYNNNICNKIVLEPLFFYKKYPVITFEGNKKNKKFIKGYLNISVVNKDSYNIHYSKNRIGSIKNIIYN